MSMTEHIMNHHQNWNLKQQRQEQVEEGNRFSHVHSNQPQNYSHAATTLLVPMSEVAELTWKNGQVSINGLSGPLPSSQEKPTCGNKAQDTLESIVQQATCKLQKSKFIREHHYHASTTASSSIAASSSGEQYQLVPTLMTRKISLLDCDLQIPSGCASLESERSLKDKILEEDSICHRGSEIQENQDDRETKAEKGQSNSTRRNRTAAIHNQSERRRRDRINQKIKALQRLVPNASKTDKASMLEEVINYLKQLQAQIQMMSMQHMMVPLPLAMQQQLQMSMLARMTSGLSLGMGINGNMVNNINNNIMAPPHTTTLSSRSLFPQLIQQTNVGGASFMMPSLIQAHYYSAPPKHQPYAASSGSSNNASISLPDPFSTTTSFAQSVNMDLMSKMAALYRQQIMSHNNQALSSFSQTNHDEHCKPIEIEKHI